jgi:hypothetical protein
MASHFSIHDDWTVKNWISRGKTFLTKRNILNFELHNAQECECQYCKLENSNGKAKRYRIVVRWVFKI